LGLTGPCGRGIIDKAGCRGGQCLLQGDFLAFLQQECVDVDLDLLLAENLLQSFVDRGERRQRALAAAAQRGDGAAARLHRRAYRRYGLHDAAFLALQVFLHGAHKRIVVGRVFAHTVELRHLAVVCLDGAVECAVGGDGRQRRILVGLGDDFLE